MKIILVFVGLALSAIKFSLAAVEKRLKKPESFLEELDEMRLLAVITAGCPEINQVTRLRRIRRFLKATQKMAESFSSSFQRREHSPT